MKHRFLLSVSLLAICCLAVSCAEQTNPEATTNDEIVWHHDHPSSSTDVVYDKSLVEAVLRENGYDTSRVHRIFRSRINRHLFKVFDAPGSERCLIVDTKTRSVRSL